MHRYTQANQYIEVRTSLPYDALLLERIQGHEAVSALFSFHLDLVAENETEIQFDKLIGENATVELRLPNNRKRYFSGIINQFSEGTRGPEFTTYSAELVPNLWLLTRTARSRIFPMKLTVPQILEKVLGAINPRFEWDGNFAPRDYCVQYNETDFNFASRLMEEEGIYYYFEHLPDSHQMVVTNKLSHPPVDEPREIVYKTAAVGRPGPNYVYEWAKSQQLRSSRYTMWDYTFQLPRNNLEGKAEILESKAVGQVTHLFKVKANQDSEIYEFPGEYAQRFDAIDKAGNEDVNEVKKIITDQESRGVAVPADSRLFHLSSVSRRAYLRAPAAF
jgi:type VI secretion system secreted protein VgrG